jgi:hypothetical protein
VIADRGSRMLLETVTLNKVVRVEFIETIGFEQLFIGDKKAKQLAR